MKKIFLIIALIPTLIFAQLVTNFEGIDFSGSKPPDPVIAVGKNHVVLAVNHKYAIYDKNGTLLSEKSFANLFSGVYFYRIQSGSFTKTMKMLLLK